MSEGVGHLKKGDYAIHVFLEEGRGFMGLEEGETIDIIASVQVLGKTKCTKPIKDVTPGSAVTWGDHFFYELVNADAKKVESQRILIEIKDHRSMLKDALIGRYEIDLTYVYYQKEHCMRHKWIVLSNPQSERFDVVRGYLRLGISVLHEKDEPVDLALVTDDAEDMMLPPEVKPETVQLIVQVLKGESLPKMDTFGGLDPYVSVRVAGGEVKTSVKEVKMEDEDRCLSIYWFEELLLPVMQPNVSSNVVVSVWDHDAGSADDLISNIHFDWDAIVRGDYSEIFWANIYGAPPLNESDHGTLMNKGQAQASFWRGRLLFKMWVEKAAKAALKRRPIESDPPIKNIVTQYEVGDEFELRAQVFNAVALPSKSDDYSIKIEWCGTALPNSTTKKAVKGTVNWFESLKRRIIELPNAAVEEMPDIFVYLVRDDKKICFRRLKVADFNDPQGEPQWLRLFPDKSVGKVVNDWEGGFVKMRIFAGLQTVVEDFHDFWAENPAPQPKTKQKLAVNLFQCRDLPPADSTGSADPYVIIYYAGAEVQTEQDGKPACLNPIWYKTLYLDIDYIGVEASPPIIVYVMDYDAMGAHDLIGMKIFDVKLT